MRVALAILFLSLFVTPMGRELYIGDETKYSQVVREMRTGSVFLPTLEGSPFTHKPPLHFWMIDVLTYVFGVYSIWPFVLPSIAAFALLLWLLHRMEGPFAAFVGGSALMIWGSAQTARMDITFNALLVLAAWKVLQFFEREDSRALLIAGIATGFAALAKGPMAPVIIIVLFLFEAWRRRRSGERRPLRPPSSGGRSGHRSTRYVVPLLAMLAVPLLWLIPAIVIGGENYWREIFFKQTVGRAVGAWVHKSPPWFYLVHGPADVVPWFLLLVVALFAAYKRGDDRAKFYVSWLLAVLVPYSLLSSKLDVYMMALLPPVGLLIARLIAVEDRWWTWGRRANVATLALFALIGAAGLFVKPEHIKGPDAVLATMTSVKLLFVVLLAASLLGLIFALRSRDLRVSTVALGFAPLAALVYIGAFLTPLANEMASTRPLIRAITRQNVPPSQVACHVCPHLWVRGMSPELEQVQLVSAEELRLLTPWVIVTRRKDAQAIRLDGYRKVDEFRMIGKDFDVYRR